MPTAHPQSAPAKAGSPTLLILYVVGLVIFFFGFTDLIRVKEGASPLFWVFLFLLGIPVLIAAHRRKPSA